MSITTAACKDSTLPSSAGTHPVVSNLVCGMHLNCLFDLRHIAHAARNTVYNPKRFPACILRIREPKSTALVFEKGKMQVLGTKSIEDARLAARKFARVLQKLGYQPRLTDFILQNMVGNADAKMVLRLEKLQELHYAFAKYEPELFPGLVYSVMRDDPSKPMKILIFTNGKMVFLGARRREEMDETLRRLWPVLLQVRIRD